MAVTQVGTPNATVYTTASAGSSGVAWSGTQPRTAGDLLVFVITAAATTSVTAPTAPAGWNTGVAVGNSGTAHAYVAIYWKIAAGGDAAPTTTVTFSGTGRVGFTLIELTGNEQILSPVDATGTEASGSTAASYTTITVTAGKALSFAGDYGISAFAFEYATTSTTSAFAAGTGWTNFSNDSATNSRDHNAVDHITSAPSQGSTPSDAASATSNGTGYTAAALIAFAPPHDPVPLLKPVRAAIPPQPRLSGVYMGASPPPQNPLPIGTPWTPPAADTSFGTGQVQWNAGGPVNNPNIPGPSGPPLGWSSPAGIRVVYVRTGLAMSTPIPLAAPAPPATPAPFYPLNQAVRARYLPHSPIAGKVTGSGSNGAIAGAVSGAGFGSGNGSKGAPVQNPNPGPVFYQRKTPVRFILPPPQPRAGRIGSSFGGPVENPVHGPPAYPLQGPVRARIPRLQPRAGRVASNPGAPVLNPAPGPVFAQRAFPARARTPLPLRGRVYSSVLPVKAAVPQPAVFYPATQALRARLPLQPLLRGRSASSAGAPVRNPVSGPVFTQKTYVRGRITPPPRGRTYASGITARVTPGTGPVFTQRDTALRAKLPLQPLLRGRMASVWGAPVQNPQPGPVFVQATSPCRARTPLPPRGRVASGKGAPVVVATQGPKFRQATSPARIRVTLPPRGRISANAGGPVSNPVPSAAFAPKKIVRAQLPLPRRGICRTIRFYPLPANPQPGPVFYQATAPVRARLPELQPRAGRIGSNPGGPVRNPVTPTSGPVFVQRTSPVQAKFPLPRRGVCRFIRRTPAGGNPQPGPVLYPLQSPVRAALPVPVLRGRIGSNPGGPVNNVPPPPPTTGPPFYPKNFARAAQPLPRRGQIRTIRFYPLPSNPSSGPVFTQATAPARIRITLPPRGRVSGNPGAPVRNPAPGPVFRQAVRPAQARRPLPPRGRTASNPGGPVQNPAPVTTGPPFRQATSPARIRPALPPRGRVASSPGAPVRNPAAGPAVYPQHGPAQARIPQVFSKGRVTSSPGGPVLNPVTPAPVYPLKNPVRIHPSLPPRGRISSGAGIPVPHPAPLYALQHPVRAQFPLPPRGRIWSNPGAPVAVPGAGPRVYPAKGPVQARRPLPPHGRVTTGNPGAPVRNPRPGPVFRQLDWPCRARIPQNAPRGRTASNPGGPVENKAFNRILVTAGDPFTLWETSSPITLWDTGIPATAWEAGEPFTIE